LERKIYFQDTKTLEMMHCKLFETCEMKNGHLMGYVIMPNHFHLLIGFLSGGKGLIEFIRTFKGVVRKAYCGNNKLWAEGFDDLEMKSMEQFYIKLRYIHYNPVKKELVDSPEKWKYSSYRFWEMGEDNQHLVNDFKWMDINILK